MVTESRSEERGEGGVDVFQEHTVRLPVGGKGMPHVSFTIPTSLSICSSLPDGKETPEAKERTRREKEEKKKKKREHCTRHVSFVRLFIYLFIHLLAYLFICFLPPALTG